MIRGDRETQPNKEEFKKLRELEDNIGNLLHPNFCAEIVDLPRPSELREIPLQSTRHLYRKLDLDNDSKFFMATREYENRVLFLSWASYATDAVQVVEGLTPKKLYKLVDSSLSEIFRNYYHAIAREIVYPNHIRSQRSHEENIRRMFGVSDQFLKLIFEFRKYYGVDYLE